MLKISRLIILVFLLSLVAEKAWAQIDSSRVDEVKAIKKVKNEIVLDEIIIDAIIEKPNVYVLPTRMESEFEEIEFVGRTFINELKAAPIRQKILEVDYDKVRKIDNLKTLLLKEKQ